MTSNRRIRIAFLVPHTGGGGAEVVLGQLLARLPADQFAAWLIAPAGQSLIDLAKRQEFSVHEHRFPAFPSTSIEIGERRIFNPLATLYSLLLVVLLAFQIHQHLRRNRIDILYTGSTYAHLIGALACLGLGCHLVWHVHEIMAPRLAGGLGPLIFGLVARYRVRWMVVPSQAIADSIRFADNISIVPNGVDLDNFARAQPAPLRSEFRIAPTMPLIGLVGRITAWKGHRLFIEAANHLLASGLDCRFIIVGDAVFDTRDYKAELLALVREFGIEAQVIFAGFRTDIPGVMQSLDIVVVPSIRPEPFGLVAVEAMASSKPVVGSNAGGLAEIVLHGETGLLFQPGNVTELAQALEQLVADSALRTRYGQQGRERVQTHYDVAGYGAAIVAGLLELNANHKH